MTESELLATSFEWDTGSPSVFFRPMNPSLSAQHFLREDSPLCLIERENWGKRFGTMLTPASPSYISQDSCCSALNNAVIMDDNETIPTAEKAKRDDVSPICQELAQTLPLATTILSENNSSLQDFLNVPQNNSSLQYFLSIAPPSSPPQWSPGVSKNVFDSPPQALHYLDGLPETPLKEVSLSAINPMMNSIQDKTTHLLLQESSDDSFSNILPRLPPKDEALPEPLRRISSSSSIAAPLTSHRRVPQTDVEPVKVDYVVRHTSESIRRQTPSVEPVIKSEPITRRTPIMERSDPIRRRTPSTEPIRADPIRRRTPSIEPIRVADPVLDSIRRRTPSIEPAGANPVRSDPIRRRTPSMEPSRADPVRSDPIRRRTPSMDPIRLASMRAEPIKSEPIRRRAPSMDPIKSEQIRRRAPSMERRPVEVPRANPMKRTMGRSEPRSTEELALQLAAEGRRQVLTQIEQNRRAFHRLEETSRLDRSVDPMRSTRRSASVSTVRDPSGMRSVAPMVRQLILPVRPSRPVWRF